jgi:hypothetical protein
LSQSWGSGTAPPDEAIALESKDSGQVLTQLTWQTTTYQRLRAEDFPEFERQRHSLALWFFLAVLALFSATIVFGGGDALYTTPTLKNAVASHFGPKTAGFEMRYTPRFSLYQKAMIAGLDYRDFRRLANIVECESGWQADAYNPKTKDYGYFQINKRHIPQAEAMGLDVQNNPDHNLQFGIFLYQQHKTKPWRASRGCWGKKV